MRTENGINKEPEIDLDKIVLLTQEQCQVRYNLGKNHLRQLADQIGAIVPVGASGGRYLYKRKVLDDYFDRC